MTISNKAVCLRTMLHIICAVVAVLTPCSHLLAQDALNHLANSTVLVIRHAEKPAEGANLNPEGSARAESYARYFHSFAIDGTTIPINALFAGSDTPNSARPRLTLEPLSRASGIPLNVTYATNAPELFAHALAAQPHGSHVLVAWRHKQIPALLKAFGAEPATLLPKGEWPNSVYDWVVFLHFDAAGKLDQQRLIHEPDPLP